MQAFFTRRFFLTAIFSAVFFTFLDLLWLGLLASDIYAQALGYLAQMDKGGIVFNLFSGISVQILIGIGMAFFVVQSIQAGAKPWGRVATGAFLGFLLYFTYDFTNHSFVRGWPLGISLLDLAWGTLQGFLAGLYVPRLWFWWGKRLA